MAPLVKGFRLLEPDWRSNTRARWLIAHRLEDRRRWQSLGSARRQEPAL